MLRKVIKYTDYNGVEREEPFYFNLNKAELTDFNLSKEGGLDNIIKRIIETKDQPHLIAIIKELILTAYGEKSDDGKYFIKNQEIKDKFVCTEAYSNLYMELVSNEQETIKFIKAIIPADILQSIEAKEREEAAKANA